PQRRQPGAGFFLGGYAFDVAIECAVEFALHLAQPSFFPMALGLFSGSKAFAFLGVGQKKTLDCPGVLQLGLQAGEHAAFDLIEVKGLGVGAATALAHSGTIDTPALRIAVLDDESVPAAAAA